MREQDGARQLLVLRVRAEGYELPKGGIELGPSPAGVRERRWIRRDEVAGLPLVNEELRPLLAAALG